MTGILEGEPPPLFIGLNPSTADETKNDPTVNRERAFSRRWGCLQTGVSDAFFSADRKQRYLLTRPGLVKANLFGWRSTKPKGLLDPESTSQETTFVNMEAILRAALAAKMVIAAWGGPYSPKALQERIASRAKTIVELLKANGITTHALAFTKDGHPRHPLYLKGDLVPMPWEPR